MTHILSIGMGWFADDPGGLNRLYAALLEALARDGAQVSGLVPADVAGRTGAPANVSFFAERRAPRRERLRACRRAVSEALRTGAVDVVAAHFALYALPALDLLGKRRFVYHFHGPWAGESRTEGESFLNVALKRSVERQVYRRADRFIVLSSAFATILEQEYGVDRERIVIVPGGVDAGHFGIAASRVQARDRLGLPQDRPLIVSVRRLIHRVGLEGLIDAMVEVSKSAPEALLLIAGRGAIANELAARISAQGLEDHVRLLGFVAEEDLPWLYRACDLSIMPSVALEGFGLPTVESLAAGTPVLVTPVGGLPETVAGLDPGLVMAGTASRALAGAMIGALRDLARLPSSEACRQYVREHFDWPVIARKVLAVYEQ